MPSIKRQFEILLEAVVPKKGEEKKRAEVSMPFLTKAEITQVWEEVRKMNPALYNIIQSLKNNPTLSELFMQQNQTMMSRVLAQAVTNVVRRNPIPAYMEKMLSQEDYIRVPGIKPPDVVAAGATMLPPKSNIYAPI